jgi:hypothetical protein
MAIIFELFFAFFAQISHKIRAQLIFLGLRYFSSALLVLLISDELSSSSLFQKIFRLSSPHPPFLEKHTYSSFLLLVGKVFLSLAIMSGSI